MERRAAIDLGTHSLRYLVVNCASARPGTGVSGPALWREAERGRISTRLGEGWRPGEPLREAAITRAVEGLAYVAKRIASLGATSVHAVATDVVRAARDGAQFVQRVKEETGLTLRVISGDEEAALSFRGVVAGLTMGGELRPLAASGDRLREDGHRGPSLSAAASGSPRASRPGMIEDARRFIVIDVGGGSTEWIAGKIWPAGSSTASGHVGGFAYDVLERRSLPLGAERLTHGFLRHDPPSAAEWDALITHIRNIWQEEGPASLWGLATPKDVQAVMVGGTVTTLAALALKLERYDRDRIHGYRLTRDAVHTWVRRLAEVHVAERKRIPGLPEERAGIIPAGAAIVLAAMEAGGVVEVSVSQWDILEALVYP